MNREIKFRIWDKELEEMNYIDLCDLAEGDDYWYDGETSVWEVMNDATSEQKRYVIQQYTSLKDKNGKEIYEGDIVDIHQTVNGYNQFVIEYSDYKFSSRYYNQNKKEIRSFYNYDLDEFFEINELEKELEVIGNIYESEVTDDNYRRIE